MQEKSSRRSNEQRSAEMRARLLTAARELFVEKGFAETGTPEIVRRAEVTRGALYHHFADKTDLFRAVAMAEAEGVEQDITASAINTDTPEEAMRSGARAFFEAMSKPGRARILLVEGPTVLGIVEMDQIDAGNGRASLMEGLKALLPLSEETEIEALAITLSAAFDRAALAIAEGEPEDRFVNALMRLIEGLDP